MYPAKSGAHDSNKHVDVDSFSILSILYCPFYIIYTVIIYVLFIVNQWNIQHNWSILSVKYPPTSTIYHYPTCSFHYAKYFYLITYFFKSRVVLFCREISIITVTVHAEKKRMEKKFSIESLFKRNVIKNGKPSLFISSHNRTVVFTHCCNPPKYEGVFKLSAEITYQFFKFIAQPIKFCRVLLKFDNARFMGLRSLTNLLFKLSNKSFKISKNRALCCILLVFILPVTKAVNRATETFTKNLKRQLAFHFVKIIRVNMFFWQFVIRSRTFKFAKWHLATKQRILRILRF